MNAERWQRIDEVFADALERPPGRERRFYLDRVCADDVMLRLEVERLLDADGESPSFLEEPACRIEAPEALHPRREDQLNAEEQRIGPYRLLRQVAEGGMGTVYLAARDDREYRRRVAVKLVRRDLVRPEALRRFRNERQILAALEHPSIARLYDGGTTGDGRPFLVMEYVDGVPITEHCDREGLAVEARLELFLKVCDAVQYAHRNLVVHRDLKPSNILVTRGGAPKLLDFGIAKLLGRDLFGEGPEAGLEAVETTAAGQRPLTPGYASPEQVRGEAVTTQSDVYSLGVLLYELLAGRSPYRGRLSHEVQRAICEDDPEKPSLAAQRPELRRRLAGDLDNIAVKALRKEPARRYLSVEQLAEDIERHLRQRPVRARPDTLAYRTGKFLRRHRAGVATAVLVLLLSAGFLATLARQSERIDSERRRSQEVEEGLTRLLVVDPEAASVHRLAASEVLDAAMPRLRAEIKDPAAEAALLDALGRVYHQAGLSHAARDLMEQSVALRRVTPGRRPSQIADSLHSLGAVLTSLGETERGDRLLDEALARRHDLRGERSVPVAETKEALALARWSEGDYGAAETLLIDAIETRDDVCPAERNYWVTEGLSHLAALYARTGRVAQAEAVATAVRERRQFFGDPLPERARSLDDEAQVTFARGDFATAEALYREALEIRRALVTRQASAGRAVTVDADRAIAENLHNLARALGERGSYEEAERYFSESLAMTRQLREDTSPEAATLLNNLAVVLGNKGEHVAAEALFNQAHEIRLELYGAEHPYVAQVRYSLGRLFHNRGDLEAAEKLYREAAAILKRTLPDDHPAWAYPQVAMGRLLLDRGEAVDAEALLREGLERLAASHAAGHWRLADAESLLGGSLAAQGRFEAAEVLLRRSYQVLQTQRSARSPRTRLALARLADLYRAWEDPPEAHY